jgi:HEAT repeat protein
MRTMKLMALGDVIAWVGITATRALQQQATNRVIYGREDGGHHPRPSVESMVRLGQAAVPELCAAIGEAWTAGQTEPSAQMIAWCQALGDIRDPRAVPTLIALCDHPGPVVRRWAALALGEIGDERSLPALTRLEGDADSGVSQAARDAIAAAGSQAPPIPRAAGGE